MQLAEAPLQRALMDAISEGVLIFDSDGVIQDCNESAEKIMGQPALKGSNLWDGAPLLNEDYTFCADHPISHVMQTGEAVLRKVFGIQRPNGSLVWVEFSVLPRPDEEAAPYSGVAILKDVTHEKLAEDSLALLLLSLFDSIANVPAGLVLIEAAGAIRKSNPLLNELTRRNGEALRGKSILDLLMPDEVPRFRRMLQRLSSGESERDVIQTVFSIGDKNFCDVTMQLSVVGRDGGGVPLILGIVENRSEDSAASEERLKASKLEALALLSRGVAHDLNNIMLAITANLELASLDLTKPKTVEKFIADAMTAARRAGDLSKRLMAFAKAEPPVKQIVNLSQFVQPTVEFALRGSNMRCEFQIHPTLLPVSANVGQISQVLDNLVINAREACPQGGSIVIKAFNRRLREGEVPDLDPADYIVIVVEDSGEGIKKDDLVRIFDPYFSTKSRGSGIGLTTAYSIVKNHGGTILADSVTGHGSRFSVYLPAATLETDEPHPREIALAAERDARPLTGSGKVLVVDDEEMVLNILSAMLGSLGYESVAAKDGREGLELFEQARDQGSPFDVVIVDATIPGGLGGKEALDLFLAADPLAKVILCSGYTNSDLMLRPEIYGFRGKLEKPFQVAQLGALLRILCSASAP